MRNQITNQAFPINLIISKWIFYLTLSWHLIFCYVKFAPTAAIDVIIIIIIFTLYLKKNWSHTYFLFLLKNNEYCIDFFCYFCIFLEYLFIISFMLSAEIIFLPGPAWSFHKKSHQFSIANRWMGVILYEFQLYVRWQQFKIPITFDTLNFTQINVIFFPYFSCQMTWHKTPLIPISEDLCSNWMCTKFNSNFDFLLARCLVEVNWSQVQERKKIKRKSFCTCEVPKFGLLFFF